eukprot:2019158-Rhodomonas_salina.4
MPPCLWGARPKKEGSTGIPMCLKAAVCASENSRPSAAMMMTFKNFRVGSALYASPDAVANSLKACTKSALCLRRVLCRVMLPLHRARSAANSSMSTT